MATRQSTGAPPTRQPKLRIVRPRCLGCCGTLRWYKSEPFCPDCVSYVPVCRRPEITVTIAFEFADELLRLLASLGWGIAVEGDVARLWHPEAVSAKAAQRTLQSQGFDATLFTISGKE